MATTTTGVKLDPETRERLKRLGEAKQRSTHWMVKEAIAQYLTNEERFELEKAEDEERWQRYLDTGTHIADDEMQEWLSGLAERAAKLAK